MRIAYGTKDEVRIGSYAEAALDAAREDECVCCLRGERLGRYDLEHAAVGAGRYADAHLVVDPGPERYAVRDVEHEDRLCSGWGGKVERN